MKIFVTGATGHLGQRLVPALERAGHQVTAVGSDACNLTRSENLGRYRDRYDQIWHLATWMQAGDFCLHHAGELWIVNQRINTNVLDWWRSQQPQAKLIGIGTSCAYQPDTELCEDNYLLGQPVPELYSYAMTKRMLLIGMRALSNQFNLSYLYLIPSTLFAPGFHKEHSQLHFIFDLIRKIILAKRRAEPVILWGDGHQKRELVFTDDFVRAAVNLARIADNEVVNVGSGQEFSIRWYAEQISSLVGYDPAGVRYDTSRYVGVRSKHLSTSKLRKLLPDFQFTPLASALEQTVRWHAEAMKTLESSSSALSAASR